MRFKCLLVLKGHQGDASGGHSSSQDSSLPCLPVSKCFSALQEQLQFTSSSSSVTSHEGGMFAALPANEVLGPALSFQSGSEIKGWIIE